MLINEKAPSFAAGPTLLGGWIAVEGDRLRIVDRSRGMSSQED
jgi:hypothetical protein